jgi:NADPH:quinone reductase-like Zn-dependent oxidoreductase
MRAAVVTRFDADDPVSGLRVEDRPEPTPADGWVTVEVKAASLNHHDLWSLRGVGLGENELPRILGTDGAGVTPEGREVVLHAVVGDPDAGGGDETLDPRRTLLSERIDGTLAERVAVPARNLVDKPAGLSFEQASCLPTAWLTAYRMLFRASGTRPGDRVLVQGVGGGVASAAIALGSAAGLRMYATGRTEDRRARALELGATAVFAPGDRLPERVDAVIETVGDATWQHSLRALRPGGTIVCSGATTGGSPPAGLEHVFFRQLRIIGSTMGTRDELDALLRFMGQAGLAPLIDSVVDLDDMGTALRRMDAGDVYGKVVVRIP